MLLQTLDQALVNLTSLAATTKNLVLEKYGEIPKFKSMLYRLDLPRMIDKFGRLYERMTCPSGARVLEIGPGFGQMLYLFRNIGGCSIHAIDREDKVYRIGREVHNVQECMVCQHLIPLQAMQDLGCYDFIYSIDVPFWKNSTDPEKALTFWLNDCASHLLENGRCSIVIPSPDDWKLAVGFSLPDSWVLDSKYRILNFRAIGSQSTSLKNL